MQGLFIVVIAIAYVTLLFAIASLGDRRSASSGPGRARPFIYALSLAIYCTSWTFFGSVGLSSERGLEFLGIYTGPVLVFVFGFPLLNRLVRLAKTEKITSIADFLGARYGKSFTVAAIATLIATIGAVPYIALQLKAISGSVSLMVEHYTGSPPSFDPFVSDISLVVAMLLALFAVLFGTRHADATEHQDGLVLAVAVETVVKLAAFLAIGLMVTFLIFGGPGDMFGKLAENGQVRQAMGYSTSLATWLVLTCLSGFAIILLPRQFYVTIVENRSEAELRTATWVFPLYLVAINLFVLPIAFAGLSLVGTKTSSDLYVLSLPLFGGHDFLAMAAFIGGLSAATAMVIVESVALSIMISNDLIIPLFVRRLLRTTSSENEDWSTLILNVRRASIFIMLFIAFLYYRESTDSARLSSIGLMSFAAIAQFAPALIGGLIWRGANGRGAALGMVAGILIWGYTLLLPSLVAPETGILVHGLFGFEALRPQALFGTVAEPLNHGVLWSLSINALFFVLGSLSRAAVPLERIQASIFVPREAGPMPSLRRFRTAVTVNDLKDTIARYLGVQRTERSFQSFEKTTNVILHGNEQASMDVIRFSEQLLASAVGSSSARLILSLLFRRHDRESRDAFRLLDDATEALQHNRDLLQIALDQMEQGITVFDRDFRLICWNRQYRELFDLPDDMGQVGVSLDQILRHLAEGGDIPTDQRVTMLNRLTSFVSPWQMELKTSGRILELRSNPMPDGGIVATYADISGRVEQDLALKRANESLEQRVKTRTIELTRVNEELTRVNEELAQAQMLAEEANLGKTRFLAAAGHDILQPLNAARLYCSSLIEKAGKGPAGKAAVNIDSSLESVETILGAVLDISRLDAGAMKPDDTAFNLDALLRQIGNDFRPLAAEKQLKLTIMPSSLTVMTDRNLLRRLIQNLVSNAIKYTRHGRILVGVRRRGELAEIQVIDTGIGIAGDKLNTVFREFTRLDEGAREAEGLGLGLSIVDRIARVLRLEIRIFSNPGKGTRFSVILPVAAVQEPKREVETRAPARAAASLAGLSVLCIDNDARILEGMRLLLEGWGCAVETVSGTTNRDIAIRRPDIVLADYHLDGETGLDAIVGLRAIHGDDLPAVLVTADRSNEVRTAAAGLDVPVINKPLKPAVLRSMMARVRPLAPAAE
ncbi:MULTISPECIES: PAS domain-containing hybrid sensor histidine kinase/response regulator [unclassified Mesorhizobium]|uniref:PAS domain-containing hybrid sensor histidine kinase/response regulator n=1 Tax=unclassified Mesorhizobium TaxID=325217 RepID=UPI00112913FD|nr:MULTISPECIES: PAS domain-containing hybrid sensor histidine kinase/response regulator [unclassified Mesorhizobium]MCA0000726.1 hybrid sensor histidine kinase/response regulator [Mesorhizobium sp. B264B2A]MCA0007207.1 hybrid sensor histidine kinase/response regulator [Mesorhizobium sp. B264B1B]MCA0020468.1 hybrid sensor histidine kinase/response regulator [Mesorhizobium sp. B264B1A]TPJ49550.1 response regulator [Mesorhizobium sp. B2-6-6]